MRVLILLALVGAAFAVPKIHQRIVGGELTTVEQYPYMSNMQYPLWGFNWVQICGGSLITTTAVLSAADCYVAADTNYQWRVLLGTSYASSGGSLHPVSEIITHADFRGNTFDYDVAIVKLSVAATIGDSVRLARIAGPKYRLNDGATVTAIGWGAIFSGGQGSEQLQHVEIKVINQELCNERYAYLKTQPGFQSWPDITDRMLCAGILDVGGKDACAQGDSGGPLAFNNDIIVGITSWGYGCADSFYPGVSARVSSLANWIVSNAL